MKSADLESDLERSFAGDRAATSRLVHAFAPVVQVRAYGVLAARGGRRAQRDVRQELEDTAQEVLYRLFADDARVLRGWDRARGLSLLNFVGMVATREVGHIMTSGKRNPYNADPTEGDALERLAGANPSGPESNAARRQLVDRLWARLKDELTPKGLEIFRMLFIDEMPVEDVCTTCAMQPDAVYAWRSRLMKRARALATDLGVSDSSEARAIP